MGIGLGTKKEILREAVRMASVVGLEGLTIGALAKRVGMSKSGLYAHFDSKEDLQVQVLDEAMDRFERRVISGAWEKNKGLPRIRRLFELWLDWITDEFTGGCPLIGGSIEFDDVKSPVRDRLIEHETKLNSIITKAARKGIGAGHFDKDFDPERFAFQFRAIILSYHHFFRLLRHPDARSLATRAFDALVGSTDKKF